MSYFIIRGVPADTVVISAALILFGIYVLVLCRKDIALWVMDVSSAVWTSALRSKKRRYKQKNPAQVKAHKH